MPIITNWAPYALPCTNHKIRCTEYKSRTNVRTQTMTAYYDARKQPMHLIFFLVKQFFIFFPFFFFELHLARAGAAKSGCKNPAFFSTPEPQRWITASQIQITIHSKHSCFRDALRLVIHMVFVRSHFTSVIPLWEKKLMNFTSWSDDQPIPTVFWHMFHAVCLCLQA